MKFVRSMALAALGLGVLGTAVGIGCGGTTTGGSGEGGAGSGGSSGTGGKGGSGGSPNIDAGPGITPPEAGGSMTTQSTPQNFAIHQLYLGDTNYGGAPGGNTMAWETMGYNIDGKITTAASTNVCTLNSGGGSFGMAAQDDGNGGIDNSFGNNIYDQVILTVDQQASMTINGDIANGTFTLMFDITGLSSSPTQTATGLSAQAFAGGKFPGTPTFTTADNWPILGTSGLLKNSSPPFQSTIQFPPSSTATPPYVVNGTWVSGEPTTISLSLSLDGISLTIPINQAVITFDHTTATHGASGIISGVIPTAQLVTGIMNLAGHISPSLCSGGALTGILAEITDASDIMAAPDSTGSLNPGPSVTCDAISIGLGFTADEIGQPTEIAAPGCPKADPCTDAAAPVCDSGTSPPPGDAGGGG
jgi:hypothetical protein